MRDTTLAGAVTGRETIVKQAGLVLGGSLFIAIAAQVMVPFYPVPMTLQTLAVLIVGLSFGARLGALTLCAYLAEGAMGLPVFAGGMAAPALIGPTAGFLFGFVLMAWAAGLAADRGLARGPVSTALAAVAASALLYLPGVAWPMALAELAGISGKWVGSSSDAIWTHWIAPFLLGDAVKALVAPMVLWGGWKAVRARSRG